MSDLSFDQSTVCDYCGRLAVNGRTHHWTERRRCKVFLGASSAPPQLGPGETLSPGGIYKYALQDHDYRVCSPCYDRLAAGAKFSTVAQRRRSLAVMVFLAIAVLVALLTPVMLPTLLSALWLTGGDR